MWATVKIGCPFSIFIHFPGGFDAEIKRRITMRTEIYINAKGQIVEERQALSKHPDGNAQQRKKAIRSGWKPAWRTTEKRIVDVGCMNPPTTEEGIAIGKENEQVAEMGRTFASIFVGVIEDQIAEFSIPEPVRLTCVMCGSSVHLAQDVAEYEETTQQDSIGE
jgi:hypothetical protein